MTPRETALALFGTDEPVPEPVRLAAGPLSAELVAGALRSIRYDGIDVLRAVAYVVRDADWGTIDPTIEDLAIDQGANGFQVRWRARLQDPAGALLRYEAALAGCPDGLTFEVAARPDSDFVTNRCGFCVLHPIIGLAGQPARVEHVDGTVEHARFPALIEPWQPFQAIRALGHTVTDGVEATCRLEGDVFEMEDQRAWSDASYKTYVRPLALPWPYRLPGGRTFAQRVSLVITDRRSRRPAPISAPEPVTVSLGPAAGTLPRIGLAITPEETAATAAQAARLAELGPQALLCHFDPTAGHGAAALTGFARLTRLIRAEVALECVVPGRDDPQSELAVIAAQVRAAGLALDSVVVSPAVDRQSTPPGSAWPPCPPLASVYAAARAAFPGVRLGGGMLSYFTELNRKRPPLALLDFVTHATCPIVHAADDVSVMQTLEALPFITRSTRAIIGDMPYRIGPATIGMRQNPYGSRTFDNPGRRRLAMAREDPRQRGLFAAAWMVGYAAAVAEAGLDLLTPAALTGPFGVLEGDAPRAAFHAAAGLAALAGRPHLACRSSRPDAVLAVAGQGAEGPVLWLANLTPDRQPIRIVGGGAGTGAVGAARPDGTAVLAAWTGAVLPPYGCARLA